jgi:hypothetical protein
MGAFTYHGSFVGVNPRRWIHGPGFGFRATFTGTTTAPWLQDVPPFAGPGGPYEATVRCSPFVPLPPPIPEVLGLAIKIVDGCGEGRDQDLTFFSTAPSRFLRALPVPRVHATGTNFTTAMSYRTNPPVRGAPLVVFGLRFGLPPAARGAESAFAELVSSLRPNVTLELLTATSCGDWLAAGRLTDFQPDVPWGNAVRFRPGNTSDRLELTRFGQLRDSLYRQLQR